MTGWVANSLIIDVEEVVRYVGLVASDELGHQNDVAFFSCLLFVLDCG